MPEPQHSKNWSAEDIKSLTESYINHIYNSYYKSYKNESGAYEKKNNRYFLAVTTLGFLATILVGLKEILKPFIIDSVVQGFTIAIFIIPSVSSILLLYMNQKGFKEKEVLREGARIYSKFLVNEAKIRFVQAQTDKDYENIYRWLNEEIKVLQQTQAKSYFSIHNKYENIPK